jgi:hypothetical protein
MLGKKNDIKLIYYVAMTCNVVMLL